LEDDFIPLMGCNLSETFPHQQDEAWPHTPFLYSSGHFKESFTWLNNFELQFGSIWSRVIFTTILPWNDPYYFLWTSLASLQKSSWTYRYNIPEMQNMQSPKILVPMFVVDH
jgi:hypothetical protein